MVRIGRKKITMQGKGFFICSSNNINLPQKPKNNIVRGCFCRDVEPIFVSVVKNLDYERQTNHRAVCPNHHGRLVQEDIRDGAEQGPSHYASQGTDSGT